MEMELDKELTPERRREIIIARLQKLIEDGYQLELNYKFAAEQNNDEVQEKYKTAIESIKVSIEFHKKELLALEA